MNHIFLQFIEKIGKVYSEFPVHSIEQNSINIYINGSVAFEKTFVVTRFNYKGQDMRFFEGQDAGFLSFTPHEISANIAPLHRHIVDTIGVVKEVYGRQSNPLFENFGYIFNCQKDAVSISDLIADCDENNESLRVKSTVDYNSLFPVAFEANGNIVLYDKECSIYLYAQDLAEDDVTLLENSPGQSFYTFNKVETLEDYAREFFSYY